MEKSSTVFSEENLRFDSGVGAARSGSLDSLDARQFCRLRGVLGGATVLVNILCDDARLENLVCVYRNTTKLIRVKIDYLYCSLIYGMIYN